MYRKLLNSTNVYKYLMKTSTNNPMERVRSDKKEQLNELLTFLKKWYEKYK